MSAPTTQPFDEVGSYTWMAPEGVTRVEYLVVGGGGGGGGSFDTGASGGGGGGMVLRGSLEVSPGDYYEVVVGNGGEGGGDTNIGDGRNDGDSSMNGSNSIFHTVIALGGGGGGGSRSSSNGEGGLAQQDNSVAPTGGLGGGNGNFHGGGGGGGAGGDGTQGAFRGAGGLGGAGVLVDIADSSGMYGVGGKGGNNTGNYNGADGDDNTGNGGEGSSSASFDVSFGGKGGSGIVILTYTAEDVPCVCAGSEVLTETGYKPIESITRDDRIMTSDGRLVQAKLSAYRVVGNHTNIPFIIPKDFFAPNKPSRELYISGRHGINVGQHLKMYPLRLRGIKRDTSRIGVAFKYYHLELPDYANDDIVCQNLSIEGFSNDYFKRNQKSIYSKKINNYKTGELFYVKCVS